MGGYGSGRSGGRGAGRCEDARAIDLAWLRKRGLLNGAKSSTITWSYDGDVVARIKLYVLSNGIRLVYNARERGEDWQDIDETIPFTKTSTNFNGTRQWFVCPSCRQRCRIIYSGVRFRCRKCSGLAYDSQYETGWRRAWFKANKFAARFGESELGEFPDKPKGMHWRTYGRLKERFDEL